MDSIEQMFQYYSSEEEIPDKLRSQAKALIRQAVCNPTTSIELLELIATNSESDILKCIAENPNCSACLLVKLSQNGSPEVRQAVCDNPNVPEEVMRQLAIDEDADVRYCLAENHNLPIAILNQLIDDDNPYVSHRALQTRKRLRQTGKASDLRIFRWFNGDTGRVSGEDF